MTNEARARLVGLNHIALDIGDIEEALAFYGAIFNFELRGRGEGRAFIDMDDQFLSLMKGRSQKSSHPSSHHARARHWLQSIGRCHNLAGNFDVGSQGNRI